MKPNREPRWQDVVWREWAATADPAVADALLGFVGDEPVTPVHLMLLRALSHAVPAAASTAFTVVGSMLWAGAQPSVFIIENVVPFALWGLSGGLVIVPVVLTARRIALRDPAEAWARALDGRHGHEYAWWRGSRPARSELVEALRAACCERPENAPAWEPFFRTVDAEAAEPSPADRLLARIAFAEGLERLALEAVFVGRGREACVAVAELCQSRAAARDTLGPQLAKALRDEARCAARAQGLGCVCRDCCQRPRLNTYPIAHGTLVPLGIAPLLYFACPRCGESSTLVLRPERIVATLDARGGAETVVRDDVWYVNWLARAREKDFEGQELFEFDAVEIRDATDTEVRHFLVDVMGDADPPRKGRYASMRCTLAPTCALEENTLRGLWAVFGEVRVGETEVTEDDRASSGGDTGAS